MNPLVSIIMPMYNVEEYIGRAIDSVLQQTFSDWELIIVNDGSKDESRNIASKYIDIDPRIRLIDKSNGGLSSARQKGCEQAIADYIVFIDSDDTLEPQYISVLYSNIIKYRADVSMCSYNTVNGICKYSHSLYFSNKITVLEKCDVFREYFLPQVASVKRGSSFLPSFMWLRMFKRNVLTKEMFVSERLVYQEDLVFSARNFKVLSRIVVVNQPLYNYFVNRGSLTQKYRDGAWNMMKSLTKEIEYALKDYPLEEVNERKQSQILSSVHFTLMNAARLDYSSFKREFNFIIKDKTVKSVCRYFSLFTIRRAYIVLIISIRLLCPLLLYRYNVKRV